MSTRQILLFVLFAAGLASQSVTAASGATIQGYVLNSNGSLASNALTIDGVNPTSANPYFLTNVSPGTHTVMANPVTGWTLSYWMCINCNTTPGANWTEGPAVTFNVPAGSTVNLWFQYTPVTTINCSDSNFSAKLSTTRANDFWMTLTQNPTAFNSLSSASWNGTAVKNVNNNYSNTSGFGTYYVLPSAMVNYLANNNFRGVVQGYNLVIGFDGSNYTMVYNNCQYGDCADHSQVVTKVLCH